MSKSTRSVERPETTDLKIVAIKIPRKLQAQLDKAAGNSYDSRNMVIRRILEQYFNGELCRADLTPLDYSHSIDFSAPATRREVPHVYPQEKFKYSD